MNIAHNKVLVEPYKTDGTLKSKAMATGFAGVEQKSTLVGLKMLTNARVLLGSGWWEYKAGTVAFIREEYLHTQQWAKKVMSAKGIEGEFIIVDAQYVEFYSEN